MRTACSNTNRPRGFTLLEILIAVLIFGIVLAAVNTVFYSALRLRNKTTESMERALPIQHAVSIIKKDLENLVSPGEGIAGELQTALTTRGMTGQSSPDFFTSTAVIDSRTPWAEVQRISYFVADSTNVHGQRDLFRSVSRNLLAPSEEPPALQWLLGGVDHVYFLYLDGTAWRETWDSSEEEAGLPRAVKVQIELNSGVVESGGQKVFAPLEIVVPVMTQSRTNTTEEATEG